MAGIYVHVPFCRQACRYCDFYFTVSLQYRDAYIDALVGEIRLAGASGFMAKELDTVYLGGGTPSVLSENHLDRILREIHHQYTLKPDAEITLEANPDDLQPGVPERLREQGLNRLSIGIQSFREKDLALMRRSHTVQQAHACLERSEKAGFKNISIDLMYGLPGLSVSAWEKNIRTALQSPVHHLSAYHLTYEPGTVFYHWRKKGRLQEITEQVSVDQYYLLREITDSGGYEHYEISNFAKPGFRSKHNTGYWNGRHYTGFGPSAHSFNGLLRRWNISSLKEYIVKSERGEACYTEEQLTTQDRYHDRLITALRTAEGVDLDQVRKQFGEVYAEGLVQKAEKFMKTGDLEKVGNQVLRMTPGGWLKSDMVISELMES